MRALEKIVQFARALGIVFLGLNSYWFCYDWFAHHALTTPVIDQIFWNLQQSTGLFTWSSITKFCALFFLVLGCYGTRSVRDGKPSKRQILLLALAGFFLLFGNDPLRSLPVGLEVRGFAACCIRPLHAILSTTTTRASSRRHGSSKTNIRSTFRPATTTGASGGRG